MVLKRISIELLSIRCLIAFLVLGTLYLSYKSDADNYKDLRALFTSETQAIKERLDYQVMAYKRQILAVSALIQVVGHKKISDELWLSYFNASRHDILYSSLPNISYASFLQSADGVIPWKSISEIIESKGDEINEGAKIPKLTSLVETRYVLKEQEHVTDISILDNVGVKDFFRTLENPSEKIFTIIVDQQKEGYNDLNKDKSLANSILLIFAPIYRTGGETYKPSDVVGFVYIAVSLSEFFDGVMTDVKDLGLDVYANSLSGQSLFNSGEGAVEVDQIRRFKEQKEVMPYSMFNQEFYLVFKTLPNFGQLISRYSSVFILVGGAFISIFSFVTVWRIRRSRQLAENLANDNRYMLERSEARTKLLLDNAGEGVVGIDKFGRIIFANKAVKNILGFREEEMLNKVIFDFIDMKNGLGKRVSILDSKIYDTLRNGIAHLQEEKKFRHKNGKILDIEISSTPVISAESSKKGGAVIMFRDITTRKQHENDLINANAELEEFAYRTSHDLKSPLISAIGLLKMVNKLITTERYAKAIQSVSMAQASLEKLEKLVGDILLLTRAKNMEEKPSNVNVHLLVEDSLKNLSYMDNYENLNIKVDCNFSGEIETLPSRVSLIVENMISNAIKYQDLNKEQSFININILLLNQMFEFSIEDNGLGIPENQKDKLFSMFKRFHPTISFGSGLGLYLIKKSADIIGGKVIFSDENGNTKFTLTIPVTQEKRLLA